MFRHVLDLEVLIEDGRRGHLVLGEVRFTAVREEVDFDLPVDVPMVVVECTFRLFDPHCERPCARVVFQVCLNSERRCIRFGVS